MQARSGRGSLPRPKAPTDTSRTGWIPPSAPSSGSIAPGRSWTSPRKASTVPPKPSSPSSARPWMTAFPVPPSTLDNAETLDRYSPEQIFGVVRPRDPSTGQPSAPWPQNSSIAAYTAEFTDRKYYALESSAEKTGRQGGEGNGAYSPDNPPRFDNSGHLFPWDRSNWPTDDDKPWVLKGPDESIARAKSASDHRLQNVQLLPRRTSSRTASP